MYIWHRTNTSILLQKWKCAHIAILAMGKLIKGVISGDLSWPGFRRQPLSVQCNFMIDWGNLPSRVFARQLKVLTRQINYKSNAHWYLTMKNYLIRSSLCARNTIYVFLIEWAVIRAFAANSELAIFPYCPYYSHSANWNSRGMSHSSHTFPERGHRIPYILCFGLWGRVPIFFCSNFRYEPFLLPKQCGKKIYFRFNFSLA